MGFLGIAFMKDLRRILRDPVAILLSVGLPLMVGLLLKIAFGGGETKPTAQLLVADHDSSFVSSLLVGSFDRGPLAELVATQGVTEERGRAMMEDGKASGLLIIPDNFGDDVFDRKLTTLTLITNPAQRILPGILKGALEFMTDALAGVQGILGDSFQPLNAPAPAGRITQPDSLVAAFSVRVNSLVERGGRYIFPPVIKVKTVVLEEEKEDTRGFSDLFFPSMLFMAILFAAQNMSDDVWREKTLGTLRRNVSTPQRLGVILAAKLLAITAFIGVVSLVGLIGGRLLFSIQIDNLPLAVMWATLSGAFMLLIFTMLQLLAASQRGANLLGNLVLFPLIMLGGSFFPFEAMPDWMARIGRMTPNGWTLEQFRRILWGTADVTTLAAGLGAMVLLGAVLFTLNAARLRRFARG
jgi:ABC-type Na+ efflux pump permease subunit